MKYLCCNSTIFYQQDKSVFFRPFRLSAEGNTQRIKERIEANEHKQAGEDNTYDFKNFIVFASYHLIPSFTMHRFRRVFVKVYARR